MNNSEQSRAKRFDNKAAIVTGASSGIGRAVATRLCAEGASVVLVAVSDDLDDLDATTSDLLSRGCAVVSMAGDISESDFVDAVIGRCLEEFGAVDVLINNAGVCYYEPVLAAPVAHLDRTLAVNVRGTYLMTIGASRWMCEKRVGAVVNTASTASFVGEEYQVSYNASKAAIVGLTRSFAIDLARYQVRVNAVAPGWVMTRATTLVGEDETQWAKHRSRIPLDRMAAPDEIAAVHAFLASDEASYVTGSVYMCDGGMTAGNRYSDWAAVVPPEEGFSIELPPMPADMHRGAGE